MFLTEFFNQPEGDSSANHQTTSTFAPTKRPQNNNVMVAESNEMADVITAREYANRALRDPVARQNYFNYLASLRAKHGKEYSISVHKKATELSSHVDEDQWSGPNNAWHETGSIDPAWSDGKGQWEESVDNPTDAVTVDVPLLIRLLEYAREDAKTDMDLHNVAERAVALSQQDRTLTMQDYNKICNTKE